MSQQGPGSLVPVDPATPAVFRTPARADTDSWIAVAADFAHLAERIATTDFVPKGLRGNVPATTAALLYGREVGLPPMTALTSIHVIEGRPGISAEGMRALVAAAGHDLEFLETTGAVCRMRARRRGSDHWTELAWSLDMARAAKLNARDNWQKYPRAMLIARCTADLCRMVFPDVIHGFRAVEELGDMDTEGGTAQDAQDARTPTSRGRKVRRGQVVRAESATTPVLADEPSGPPPPIAPPLPPLPGEPDAGEVAAHPRGVERAAPDTSPAADVAASVEQPAATSAPPNADTGRRPSERPPVSAPDEDPGEMKMRRFQQNLMFGQLGRLGLEGDKDEQLALISALVGRDVTSRADLTAREAVQVTQTISKPTITNATDLRAFIAAAEAANLSPLHYTDDPLPIEDPPDDSP